MIELHTMISPILEAQTIDPAFETDRKLTSASDEWLDPFRMSFGKNCGSGLRIWFCTLYSLNEDRTTTS